CAGGSGRATRHGVDAWVARPEPVGEGRGRDATSAVFLVTTARRLIGLTAQPGPGTMTHSSLRLPRWLHADSSVAQPKGSHFMTKAMWKGLLGVLLAAAVVLPLRAAEPKNPQHFVVLVGISEYADKQINPRPNAENDAKALYDLFTDTKYLGVD